LLVAPAKAEAQFVYLIGFMNVSRTHWIPACAGMTNERLPPFFRGH
jgi:hypothetical protein